MPSCKARTTKKKTTRHAVKHPTHSAKSKARATKARQHAARIRSRAKVQHVTHHKTRATCG